MIDKDSKWFTWLLQLMFIHLKLAQDIEWSWWAVFCPMYFLAMYGALVGILGNRKREGE